MKKTVQELAFPTDMFDKEFERACDSFNEAVMDAYLRREMRYMIQDTDDSELAEACIRVLQAYTVGPVDPNLPGT